MLHEMPIVVQYIILSLVYSLCFFSRLHAQGQVKIVLFET